MSTKYTAWILAHGQMVTFLISLALIIPQYFYIAMPSIDAAHYYLPMSEALLRGDFERAFAPNIPPLIPVIQAVIASVLRLDVFLAARVTSSLFTVLNLLLLYIVIRRCFSVQAALIAVVCFCIHPLTVQFAASTILAPGKIFFTLLALYSLSLIVTGCFGWRLFCFAPLSLAGLMLVRGEAILTGLFLTIVPLLIYLGSQVRRYVISGKETPAAEKLDSGSSPRYIKALLVVLYSWGLALLLISPWLFYTAKEVGFPLTDARQLSVALKLPIIRQAVKEIPVQQIYPKQWNTNQRAIAKGATNKPRYHTFGHILKESVQGVFQPFVFLVGLGIALKVKRRTLNTVDGFLLCMFTANLGTFYLAGLIIDRYVYTGTIFLLPFVSYATTAAFEGRRSRSVTVGLACIFCIGSGLYGCRKGMRKVTAYNYRPKYATYHQTYQEVALRLKQHFTQPETDATNRPMPVAPRTTYFNGKKRVILGADSTLAYLADAEFVSLDHLPLDIMNNETLAAVCQHFNIDLLITDGNHFRYYYPNFNADNVPFLTRLFTLSGADLTFAVYRIALPQSI